MDNALVVKIPGQATCILKHVVFDYNGTLAWDGELVEGVLDALNQLSDVLDVYVITADTYGTVRKALEGSKVQIHVLKSEPGYLGKEQFVMELGAEHTIAVGNGRNDRAMLEKARIGVAVIGPDGAAREAIDHADIVVHDIMDAIRIIQTPKALIAVLRD